MKIINLDKNNPRADEFYDALENFLRIGAEYLPFIFLKKVKYKEEVFQIPRWITKRHLDTIDMETKKFMDSLNRVK